MLYLQQSIMRDSVFLIQNTIKTARSINPEIIINNRTQIDQDLWTPEQYQPTDWIRHPETGELVTWETCQTFSGSWGYHRDEHTWKSHKMLIDMLVKTVSCGGNLIMNVGPTSRGYIDKRAEDALAAYEKWMKYNSRSIYGCTMAEPEFTVPNGACLTQSEDGKRLYVHLLDYPFAFMEMYGLAGKIDYAQFLHDGSEVLYNEKYDISSHQIVQKENQKNMIVFKLPPIKPDMEVPVIEIFLK